MTWAITDAKALLNISGTVNDVALQKTMDEVISLVEDFLGRGLLLKRETISFKNVDYHKILLPRFPIKRVTRVNGVDVGSNSLIIHHRTGWISFGCDSHLFDISNCGRTISIEYEGGYPPSNLPDALERALWEIFLQKWSNSNQTIGGPTPGAGPTITQGTGDVKSLTVFDGFKLDYDVGTTVTGASSSGSSGVDVAMWGELAPWASLLSLYRSEHGVGLGFA